MDRSPSSGQPDPTTDLINALTVIRGRAQVTRRRMAGGERHSRERMAIDLAEIEAQADHLVRLLFAGGAEGEAPGASATVTRLDEEEG